MLTKEFFLIFFKWIYALLSLSNKLNDADREQCEEGRMTRGSALLISSSSWIHTDLRLHPKAWRELWWCEDSDVSAVQA